ncbi:transposase [Paenibacillus intestini]|nr:transposase [Paenibacillus intestini]
MVRLLLTMIEQLNELEQQVEEMAASLPEVELVKTIPGIGTKLAAAIIAEIGDIRQFNDAKQLVAFAGLDPGFSVQGS